MNGIDRKQLEKALRRLGELGIESGFQIELNIYGGSAMILAYDLGRRTRDVDAVFRPRDEVLQLARQVAEEQQLPDSWLNDEVKVFLSETEDKRPGPVAFDGIRIQIPTARYLLALKARAAREPLPGYDGDRGDLAFLIRKMEIRTLQDVQKIIDSFFPDDVIPPDKARYLEFSTRFGVKTETQWRELPKRLADVANRSEDLATFGMSLREWEHHVSREGVHSRPALLHCVRDTPERLSPVFEDGYIADAYLAALAEWLSLKYGLPIPLWVDDDSRIAKKAWWAHTDQHLLLAKTPSSFRTRHLFTIPNDPFTPKRGRPRVPEEVKREKQRLRQKRYRERINVLVEEARRQRLA